MARAKKITSIEHLDTLAKRLRARLKRTMTALDKLEKQKARLLKAAKAPTVKTVTFEPMFEDAVPVSPPAYPTVDSETTLGTLPPVTVARAGPAGSHDDLGIPEFLRRGQAAQAAVDDAIAAEKIRAEQAATKKAKAQGRIATMKAKKSGETRKMPLTGKAALDLINNG
jgi:predicted  nucleic acid-binding Zn-ribbon protein